MERTHKVYIGSEIMNNMTLEEALKRIEFLEKALNGAIGLGHVEQKIWNGKPIQGLETKGYVDYINFEDEPELAEYIMERKKNDTAT